MMIEPLPLIIQAYLNDLSFKGRKETTIKRYMYDLLDFHKWVKQNCNGRWSLTKDELEFFFYDLQFKRGYHIRTIKRIHTVLKQVARFQKDRGQTELRAINLIEPPELTVEPLSPSEWITIKEEHQLLRSLQSTYGLSEKQSETFPYYQARNECIVRLFLHYGLTLQEVAKLSMKDVHFHLNQLHLYDSKGEKRTVPLSKQVVSLFFDYIKTIPEPVRPAFHSHDPFFVAFDFQRKTYHWSYADQTPKRITMIAIQKMLRLEVKRARLRKGISAQTLRNTAILRKLVTEASIEQLKLTNGYTSEQSLQRFIQTTNTLSNAQKSN